MKRKIKEKFITVNKTRISTAFAVYFFVIFAILIIQLLTCGSQGFESFTFGKQADLQYEIPLIQSLLLNKKMQTA